MKTIAYLLIALIIISLFVLMCMFNIALITLAVNFWGYSIPFWASCVMGVIASICQSLRVVR